MNIICAHCGLRRPHEARGLCQSCYQQARRRGLLGGFARKVRTPGPRTVYWREYKRSRKHAA